MQRNLSVTILERTYLFFAFLDEELVQAATLHIPFKKYSKLLVFE